MCDDWQVVPMRNETVFAPDAVGQQGIVQYFFRIYSGSEHIADIMGGRQELGGMREVANRVAMLPKLLKSHRELLDYVERVVDKEWQGPFGCRIVEKAKNIQSHIQKGERL